MESPNQTLAVANGKFKDMPELTESTDLSDIIIDPKTVNFYNKVYEVMYSDNKKVFFKLLGLTLDQHKYDGIIHSSKCNFGNA